jgi:hypothetical protein
MKEYTKPVMEITALNNEDVVTKSGGIVTSKFTSEKGYSVVEF